MKPFFFLAHVIYQVRIITRITAMIPHYIFAISQTVTLVQYTNNH